MNHSTGFENYARNANALPRIAQETSTPQLLPPSKHQNNLSFQESSPPPLSSSTITFPLSLQKP